MPDWATSMEAVIGVYTAGVLVIGVGKCLKRGITAGDELVPPPHRETDWDWPAR